MSDTTGEVKRHYTWVYDEKYILPWRVGYYEADESNGFYTVPLCDVHSYASESDAIRKCAELNAEQIAFEWRESVCFLNGLCVGVIKRPWPSVPDQRFDAVAYEYVVGDRPEYSRTGNPVAFYRPTLEAAMQFVTDSAREFLTALNNPQP